MLLLLFATVSALPRCGTQTNPTPISAPVVLTMTAAEYVNNMNCFYLVNGASRLVTTEWSIEPYGFDSISIYDGTTVAAPLLYSGGDPPPALCSSSSHFLLHWMSDFSVSGDSFDGFQLVIDAASSSRNVTCLAPTVPPDWLAGNCTGGVAPGSTCIETCRNGTAIGTLGFHCDLCGQWIQSGFGYCSAGTVGCNSQFTSNTANYANGTAVYIVELTNTTWFRASTCNTDTHFDSVIGIFSDPGLNDLITFNDDAPGCTSNPLASVLEVQLSAGTYYLVVIGYDADTGPYTLSTLCELCGESSFLCGSGECIPVNFRCDRIPDCNDGSDEVECIYGECESCTSECFGTEIQNLSVVLGQCSRFTGALRFFDSCVQDIGDCRQAWEQNFCGAIQSRVSEGVDCNTGQLITPNNCDHLYTCLRRECQQYVPHASLCGGNEEAMSYVRCERLCRRNFFNSSTSLDNGSLNACIAGCACSPATTSHTVCTDFCLPDNTDTAWSWSSYDDPTPQAGGTVGDALENTGVPGIMACLDGCGYRGECYGGGSVAAQLGCGSSILGVNTGGGFNADGSANTDILYTLQVKTASHIKITTCNPDTDFDTTLTLYWDSSRQAQYQIIYANDDSTCDEKRHSTIELDLVPWNYTVVVGGLDGAQGSYRLAVFCEGPPEYTTLTCGSLVSGDTSAQANLFPQTGAPDVIYQFAVADQVKIKVDTCQLNTLFNTDLYLYSDLGFKTKLAESDPDTEDCEFGDFAKLEATVNPGEYYLILTGKDEQAGRFKMTVSCDNVPSSTSMLGVGVAVGIAVMVFVVCIAGVILFVKRKALTDYLVRRSVFSRWSRQLETSQVQEDGVSSSGREGGVHMEPISSQLVTSVPVMSYPHRSDEESQTPTHGQDPLSPGEFAREGGSSGGHPPAQLR